MEGVALEYDFAVLVHEHDVGNALDFVLLHRFLIRDNIIFNISPPLITDMILHRHDRVVTTEPDDSHAAPSTRIVPRLAVFLHHRLVVRHWLLAGRAPGGPEIDQ